MGPTASGKTNFACELVSKYPFEIISVDSAMIYKDMSIGTAKPDDKTLKKAPHHLIDFLEPTKRYSAAKFCSDANELIRDILRRGRYPLLVGGTMMYFNALQTGLSLLPEADDELRERLLFDASLHGWQAMYDKLKQVDPLSAEKIKPTDTQRIQRALEVYELTNKPLSEFKKISKKEIDYEFLNICLMPSDRKWLHERIAQRFHEMLNSGFMEEVRSLLKKWPLSEDDPALRSVGYRQAYEYLNGGITKKEFEEKSIAATRQLAKRQLTWLRSWSDAVVVEPDKPGANHEIEAIIENRLCLKNL